MQLHVYTIAKACSLFGIEHAVICPGSRSAPLVYAFANEPQISCKSVIDERSAGFLALGMAQQMQKPVVLISTSGTACLNFAPAIAEAYYQKIPLLVLTADRPPELLNQQDGQMIMQKNVFGKHVRSSHELMCFDEDQIDFKLTERIVFTALEECTKEGLEGPVHINVPLREPLYDIPENPVVPAINWLKDKQPKPSIKQFPHLEEFIKAWKGSFRKMILVGQMPPSKDLQGILNTFMNQDDVVVLADIASNQHESSNAAMFDSLLQWAPPQVLRTLEPDLIISFGGPFVSKSLKLWLKSQKPAHHFRIQPETELIDTYQNATHFVKAQPLSYLYGVLSHRIFKQTADKDYAMLWKNLNKLCSKQLKSFTEKTAWSEPLAVHHLLGMLPENSMLQLANSSSVRWASWNGLPLNSLCVFSNRGTSGIDGSTSTAIGAARAVPHQMVTLITGDLSLFYDQNAFWQESLPSNLRIIVLNNAGGNIFNWIDGPSKHPEWLHFFNTPHNLSVANLAKQFNVWHRTCESLDALNESLKELYQPKAGPAILELCFENQANLQGIQAFRKIKLH